MDFQDSSGSISVYAHTSFLAPRLTNSPSATSIATAATCYISSAPVDSGSGYVAITNPYALYVNSGDSYFGGRTTSNFITSNNPIAGATFAAPAYSSKFNIVCQNNSTASGAFSGIAFHNDVGGLGDTTPSAAIISQRTSATGYEASSIEFWTKSSATQTANLTKRMTIAKDGKISFGSTTTGDGQINLLTAGDASFRFGAALSNKDCFTMSYYHNGPNNDWNKLSWQVYGISNTLALFANGRVCINGNAPESQFHVVSSGILYGSWERAQEWWNDNATPMKAGLIMYNESGGSDNNGVSFGTYTADPLNFMIGGSNCMQLNTSKRLNINRTSGPEGTVHAGGMIWADEGFHSKVNINDKPIYRWNWPQSNYPAIGSDATVGAMRIDTCNGSYVWQAYMPCRGGAYTNASDRRIKRDIIDIPYGLAEVLRMQPKKFAMRNDGSLHIGFIAQEMAEIIPECVSGVESPNDAMNDAGEPCNPMGIDLASLVSVLCKAIQELKKEVDELRAIIAE
ncbi:hypothetical protein PI125_g4146 [Phytophthora idaei]|nr:hypothetical protein PI125_g4146 [Phytophthora idaei]KAG3159480.1 hypothetical protein PI126_g7376 [Phytophthora idaei]